MKTISQSITFNASADELYELLVNPRKLTKITGEKAANTQKEGGKFSAYDNYITGTNIKLSPGKLIIQKWTCQDFPEGTETEVKIELKKKTEKTTDLVFTHTGVPDDFFEDISEGWNQFYWEPIKDYLDEKMWG